MGVSDGPRLVVDPALTYRYVVRGGLWEALPPGLADDLIDWAGVAAAAVLQAAMGRPRAVTPPSAAMAEFHDVFWDRLARAYQAGVGLDGLVAFVAADRGYRPRPVEVYYKSGDGRPAVFAF